MSNSNLTYNFHDSNIRVVQSDKGEVLFCLADVCASLNLSTPAKTANQIKEEFQGGELNSYPLQTKGGVQQCTMITEPQLYFVMMRSNSKIAREFRQWICNEVLPSIRAHGAYVGGELKEENHEAEQESTKRCWYVQQLTELSQKYNITNEALVAAINITQRAFKQGYAIALRKAEAETKDKQPKVELPKPDERLTLTEDEVTAVEHMVHYHELFRPDLLKAFKKFEELQAQAAKLLVFMQEIPVHKIYDSATATDISVERLKRFKSQKNALIVG
jgi:prophage antirepressor-like protein